MSDSQNSISDNPAVIDMVELTSLRHWLHAHPEISREEIKTSEYLREYLHEKCHPDEIILMGRSGFAAVYKGALPGKTVLIRTELDALPIHDANYDLSYRSVIDGVSHKCGHDGHMTILVGLAHFYANQRPSHGKAVLLFQPDEETGTGARECCFHPNFKHVEPDYAFALHNLPGFPRHSIICKTNGFASAVKFVAIKLQGKEAHSAQPETGASPAQAIAEITQMSMTVQQKFDGVDEYALIVPIHFQMGVSSSGVSPAYGEAQFTLRTPNNDLVDDMWADFLHRATSIAHAYDLELTYEILEEFAANFNNEEAVGMIKQAAEKNQLSYIDSGKAFRWGEDFGEITKLYKGAMFGLGAGESMPDLHNPDYNFPDEIIPTGIKMFQSLVGQALRFE